MFTAIRLAASALVLLTGSVLQLTTTAPIVPAPDYEISVSIADVVDETLLFEVRLGRPALDAPVVIGQPEL